MAQFSMTRAAREAFLADTRVAVLSVNHPGRAPLAVPVWYTYEAGGVIRISTHGSSKKALLLRDAGRASLCVQAEKAPYKYVSVEGPVTFDAVNFERDMRQMAHRYLGERGGEAFLKMTAEQRAEEIIVVIKPEHWLTVDYGKS